MGAFVLAALLAQAAEVDDAAIRRYAALLARPESRARGVDRLSHLDPKTLLRLGGVDPLLVKAAEQNEALRHSYGAPRVFSFDGHEEELDDVLSRLERGSGFVFQRGSLPRGLKVGVRLEDATVLEALSELGRAASFTLLGMEGGQIYLQPGVPVARPRSFHGPLMIELERVSRRTRQGFDATTHDFRLRLALWWEPSVRPLLDAPPVCVVTRAVDDTGRSLLSTEPPPAGPRTDAYPKAGYAMATVEGLRAPAADARSLSMEGTLDLRFPARVDRAAFQKPGVVEVPGLRIELATLGAAETGGMTAEFRVRFDEPGLAAAYRPLPSDLTFESNDPELAFWRGVSGIEVKDGEVSFTVRSPALRRIEDVTRLHLRVPQGAVVKRVPFRFDGVDLR